ncbi:SDR family oxidoreductase [Silvimonas iriomotensis]|uniref:NAD-dependent epimerase/dehydratase domain-containing protein n=1 Tax=Silvimonas iriomotensis TaxID=449662 RepID=A0ABQ2P4G1_9NEIS|nr:SDR family oxidoreductase [Silvimonas iriomotensis]GGP18025.1 hypothetical protein GCM10010970_02760 [Silvimonas iriomotensis]
MKVFLVGADGFLGRHIARALLAAGHAIVPAVRQVRQPGEVEADFTRLQQAELINAMRGCEVLINCAGLFRETASARFDAVHIDGPRALYQAAVAAGVRRGVLISALGAAPHAVTAYWRSKAAGEAVLHESGLPATVIRPSLVYGEDGASTRWFVRLAQGPLALLPARRSRVQPMHVDDLAQGVVAALSDASTQGQTLAAAGPQTLDMAQYLQQLRGRGRCRVVSVGPALCNVAARVAQHWPGSLLTPESLAMLAEGNVAADAEPFARLVGRPLRQAADFVSAAARWQARIGLARCSLQAGLALVWLGTAVVSLWLFPVAGSNQLLAACHVPPPWFALMRIGAAVLDAALGVLTLLAPGRRLWQGQIALIAVYSVIVALCLPEFLVHPFGPLLKNAGLLGALFALLILEEN